MLVTLEGMVIEVRPVQNEKACSPMLVTLEGMVIEVRPLQNEKAYEPMVVTVVGITVFLHPTTRVFDAVSTMALQLFRESYLLFPEATSMASRLLQLSKTLEPILVTLEGMDTEVKPLQ